MEVRSSCQIPCGVQEGLFEQWWGVQGRYSI